MKIDLTKDEYKLLLDMLATADWVINAHKSEPDEKTEPYDQLQQKIFALAKEYGLDNLIHYDPEIGEYSPTLEFEENANDQVFIDEYDEDTFWDLLAIRMAQRDLVDQVGEDAFDEMEPTKRLAEVDTIAEKYFDEFTENGITNLRINPIVVH
ncbi:MAG: hypothetical protein FP815_03920 [Desulfobulbaceae bacterium]|nr:hypothetical protein [Desulfobulbaceae bacterium]